MPRRVYPSLAAYLKAHPHESAYSLAEEFGCSAAYVSMLKWGTRQPGLPLALKIAARCNIPLESLLRREARSA